MRITVISQVHHIKLCLLLWLKFFKTISLLLSVRRDFASCFARLQSGQIGFSRQLVAVEGKTIGVIFAHFSVSVILFSGWPKILILVAFTKKKIKIV